MSMVAEQSTALARPLKVLVPLIKADLHEEKELADRATMEIKRSIGNKLIEARSQQPYKEAVAWCQRNFGFGRSQMDLYISLADTTADLPAATGYESLKDFRRRGLGHDVPTSGGGLRQPSWRESVNENIERARREAERLRQEDLTRKQERDAEKTLALRLIDIGFKILVKELHPDKGGSRDAMSRLNRVRDRLKTHA